MKRMVLCAVLAALGGCSGKMKMPDLDVKMPKVLEDEKADVKVRKEIDLALKLQDEPEAYFRQMSRLFDRMKEVGWDQSRLVAEILDYAAQVKGQDQAARYTRLLGTLDIPRTTVVEPAVQRLDSGEPATAEASRVLLRWAAPPDPRVRTDYSHFRPYLESHPTPPRNLVLWMYERDAAAAMAEMRNLYGKGLSEEESRNVVLGEHVVSEVLWRQKAGLLKPGELDDTAVAQLARLADVPQWWVRLYVAEILLQNPRLRGAEVVKRLQGERNELVKSVVDRVAAG